MDLYINVIDEQKFRSTNAIWNELQLNHPMSVGYVTTLIESQTFHSKEEWRNFYYRSGERRIQIAKEKNINLCSQSFQAKQLNGNYGRTEDELRAKGRLMYEAIVSKGNPLSIKLSECIYMVKYRVLGETWNGVAMRERNTLNTLQKYFPQLTFKKVNGEMDFQYGIDFEIYNHHQLIGAIQVKPLSYQKGLSQEIKKAKTANERKNQNYKMKFGKEVHYVYSSNKGEILNKEILTIISSIIQPQKQAN